ncbi:unnamed protein product [Thlaspi arvense]|uniref:PHD finger protein ALFIN-LIKE n=1 Tax=Thlaspi arvense TaxID=13288 RepID=A0AAU9RJU8_THLAR|nr:unnamed protein product [Thlaspi arvense]
MCAMLMVMLQKENLCLYGFPVNSGKSIYQLKRAPEPALGINFARDGMQEKDWLSLVAVHSDAWLLAVAFYFGARFGFDTKLIGTVVLRSTSKCGITSAEVVMISVGGTSTSHGTSGPAKGHEDNTN